MRLKAMKTCMDADHHIQGIQFDLADDIAKASEQYGVNMVQLEPIGNLEKWCSEMTIEGPLSGIRASYSEKESALGGLAYFKDNQKKTYGEVGDDYTEWDFTDDNPVVGIEGEYNERGIQKLGLITLDVKCQQKLKDGDKFFEETGLTPHNEKKAPEPEEVEIDPWTGEEKSQDSQDKTIEPEVETNETIEEIEEEEEIIAEVAGEQQEAIARTEEGTEEASNASGEISI